MEVVGLSGKRGGGIKEAAEIISRGGVVVYPTDTLYGLGCNALDRKAVKRIFNLKNRPYSKPISIAVNSMEMLERYAQIDERTRELLERFLPGALTVILHKKELPDILTSDKGEIAIRIPDSEVALAIIEKCGVPITATSANLSGAPPPVSVEEALEQISDIDMVLDGGKLGSRVPSTIIDLTGRPKIIREGRIPNSDLLEAFREIYNDWDVQEGRENSGRDNGRGRF